MREAFVRLREIGLIEPDGRRGGRVVQASRPTIAEMYEVREGLEAQAARLAAERADTQAKASIARAAARSLTGAQANDRDAFQIADLGFHEAIAASTRNDRLETLVRNSLDLIAAVDFVTSGTSRPRAAARRPTSRRGDRAGRRGRGSGAHARAYPPRVRDGSGAHFRF